MRSFTIFFKSYKNKNKKINNPGKKLGKASRKEKLVKTHSISKFKPYIHTFGSLKSPITNYAYIKMSSGNRKTFDDDYIRPLRLGEEDLSVAMVAVVILFGILTWYIFGIGNQIEDFARDNGVVEQIKDISSFFNNISD